MRTRDSGAPTSSRSGVCEHWRRLACCFPTAFTHQHTPSVIVPWMQRTLLLAAGVFAVMLLSPLTSMALGGSSLPTLNEGGIGSVHFGASKAVVVAALRTALGKPNAEGVNAGCGATVTEVAWDDLIAEFHGGTFTGYRFIEGGWPLSTQGGLSDRVTSKAPTPPLETAGGITLGNTVGEALSTFGYLKFSGAVQWTTTNGLTFVEPSTVVNPRAASDRIAEIKVRTCGAF